MKIEEAREELMRRAVKYICMFLPETSGLSYEDTMEALKIATEVLNKIGVDLNGPGEVNAYIKSRIGGTENGREN